MSPKRADRERPVYMIGIAATLAGMHPQTLRIYERKCLVRPCRSSGNTRLYSEADIERLRLIHQLTQDEGINLAGVERILELRAQLDQMHVEMEGLRAGLAETERRLLEQAERIHKSYRAELVLVPRGGLVRRRPER